jgi:hypothetical protein
LDDSRKAEGLRYKFIGIIQYKESLPDLSSPFRGTGGEACMAKNVENTVGRFIGNIRDGTVYLRFQTL